MRAPAEHSLYIPKWVSLNYAINHLHAWRGGIREDAQELLFIAMRDADVKARPRRPWTPVPPIYWRAPAINPVHLHHSDSTEIEICTAALFRLWPMPYGPETPAELKGAIGAGSSELAETEHPPESGLRDLGEDLPASADAAASEPPPLVIAEAPEACAPALGDADVPESPQATITSEPQEHVQIRNTRGPESRKRNGAVAAMIEAVRNGKLSITTLAEMK